MDTKFKIKSIKMLNSWCYNLTKNNDCTICRTNLNNDSIYCIEKGKESILVTGLCGHAFHFECIHPWVTSHPNCPICSEKWEYQK